MTSILLNLFEKEKKLNVNLSLKMLSPIYQKIKPHENFLKMHLRMVFSCHLEKK